MSKIATALCILATGCTGFALLDAYLLGAATHSDLLGYLAR
jgi:hypothetical protein